MKKTARILMAAGGTGGHIYPALALAKAIQRQDSAAKIEFVGTKSGLESQLVPREGFHVNYLSIGRLNSNVAMSERILTLLRLPLSFLQSVWILIKFRPTLVLGVGGHASGPLLLMASLLGKRTAIWEPNAIPGLANRILSRFVGRCYVVFEATRKYLKNVPVEVVGLPVRGEIEQLHDLPYEIHKPFRVLVFGGSQGARTLNTVVMNAMKDSRWKDVLEVVHQTGSADFERIKQGYGQECPWVQVSAYLYDMDKHYAACDFVIARSGTGTLSELAACKRPSLLVPLPTAADDHQRKNAEVFVDRGASDMILQPDFDVPTLTAYLQKAMCDEAELKRKSKAVSQFFTLKAADSFALRLLGR